jgi:hypothetical protein
VCARAGRAGAGGGRVVRAAEGDSLKDSTRKIDDLTLTTLKLDAKALLPCLLWADDKGTAFLVVDGGTGVVRRVSVPDFKVVKEKDLGRKVAWLNLSAEGPVASIADNDEIWVLDRDSLDVKKKINLPNLKRAVSAPGLSLAFAATMRGADLSVVDLKTGKATKYVPPAQAAKVVGFIDPVLSPDGSYLFGGTGIGNLCRFKNDGGKLTFVDKIRTHAGAGFGICVSPDSKFVCQPAGTGNAEAGGSYRTIIFPIDTFAKKECVLEPGAHPKPVGWDPAGGAIYTGNTGVTLLVMSLTGVKKKEYKIDTAMQRQYLAHPEGNKLLLLTGEKMYFAELPQ